MAVAAITPDYTGERRDRVENFHGNQVVYVGWDHHLMFCSPVAFALPPDTPFGKLQDDIIPGAFSRSQICNFCLQNGQVSAGIPTD